MIYLFLGLTRSGKTTAARLLTYHFSHHHLGYSYCELEIIHPFDEGKRFLEKVYELQPGFLDDQTKKHQHVLDLDGKPIVWRDGHSPTYQDLMVKEYLFREEVDPFFSSRYLERKLDDYAKVLEYGVNHLAIHGVRKKEEVELIVDYNNHYTMRDTRVNDYPNEVEVVYLTRNGEYAKPSDSNLQDNLKYLKDNDIKVYEVENNFETEDELKDYLGKLIFPNRYSLKENELKDYLGKLISPNRYSLKENQV